MKKVLVLLFFAICCYLGYSQHNINGIYSDNIGVLLEVRDSCIYFREFANCNNVFATTGYIWKNDQFIAIIQNALCNSISGYGIKIKEFDDNRKHIIHKKVILYFSQLKNKNVEVYMGCTISADWEKDLVERKFIYKPINGKKIIRIPKKTINFFLSIRPETIKPLQIDSLSGYYNGFVYCETPLIEINKDVNIIEIDIPGIDDGYFGRYYINGDYVRVDGDKLYWRGRVFEKSTDPDDIEYISRKSSENK